MDAGCSESEHLDSPSVLASCLDRIAQGEPADAVLASVPGCHEALVPLIVTADLARSLRSRPDDAFRARLGHLVLTADLEPVEPGARPVPSASRPRGLRATLRLSALAAAVALALGALATGAGASPGSLVSRFRRSSMEALVAVERWAMPQVLPARPAALPTMRRVASLRGQAADVAAPAAEEPARPDAGSPATSPSPSAVMAWSDEVAPSPPPTMAATATSEGPLVEPARTPVPTVGAALANDPLPPAAPSSGDPTPSPGIIVANEEATAVAAGSAPVIAPAPPAVIGGGGISGVVTFVDESVFPGVTVTAYPLDRRGNLIWQWGASVRSDVDGSYRIVRLFAGRYKVAVGELGPWVYRRWYLDTRHEREAEPIDVRSGRITENIDVRTRVWPLGGLVIADPAAALRWLRWY